MPDLRATRQQRQEGRIVTLPYDIPQPNRSLGVLRLTSAPRAPSVERFAAHVIAAFDNLRHVIRRHERVVVWGAGQAEANPAED